MAAVHGSPSTVDELLETVASSLVVELWSSRPDSGSPRHFAALSHRFGRWQNRIDLVEVEADWY